MDDKHSDKIVNVLIVVLVELYVVEITHGITCPVDWKLIDGVCFQYSQEKNATWSEAEELCTKKYNSSLIVINSQNVYDKIREHVSDTGTTYWIGAKREAFRKGFIWIDGTNLWKNKSFWLQDKARKSTEKCVQLRKENGKDAGLNDNNCDMNIGYICGSPDVTGCNADWNIIGNTCIKLFGHTDELSWCAAEASCKKLGSTLAVIEKANLPTLVSLLTLSYDEWSVWIGAELDDDGIFKWIDGSTISDSLWLPGEPNGFEYCVHFMINPATQTIGMNDVPCSQKSSFICGFKECRQIRNCKRQTCLDANAIVCNECEDNFQLTSDHLQCQLIQNTGGEQNSYSESPMFIYGWACAAILLIVLITTCVGFCIRGRESLNSNTEEENVRRPPQSSRTQLGKNTIETQRTIGSNYGRFDLTERLPKQCDDCYDLPNTYIELQNQNVNEHMYNV